jgi:hypothetical protein
MKTKVLQIRVDEAVIGSMKREADKAGESLSTWVRAVLEGACQSEAAPSAPPQSPAPKVPSKSLEPTHQCHEADCTNDTGGTHYYCSDHR